MPIGISQETLSVNSYQGLDGKNTTIAGYEHKLSTQRGSAGAFVGFGTDFYKNADLVIDLKGAYNYDKNGIVNQNLRVRNKVGLNGSSTQIRYSPATVNVPIGKNTSAYINPHYSGKFDYKNNKWTNSAGVFAGITQKINDKTSISLEGQRYNLQDIKDNSAQNWSINAIISYKL